MILFVFSPAVAAQYFVRPAPFILLLSPTFYGFLVSRSSVLLFALYTITSGSFQWYYKNSAACALWALVPWLTLVGGLIALGWNARRLNPNIRIVSFKAIQPAATSE